MTEFIPHGYISLHETLDHLGRELFPSEWTGQEQSARTGLMGIDEWLRIKDLPPARGGGAPGCGRFQNLGTTSSANSPQSLGDPSSDSYQMEYRAGKRCEKARDRLRALLEGGDLQAVILDPFTGALHRAATNLWRRWDAARMIKKGEAPIPGRSHSGSIIIKDFRVPDAPAKPLPAARIADAIKVLQEEMAKKSLTRSLQEDFVREKFPGYRVTEEQIRKIFQSIKVPLGRPKKKSDATEA